RRDVHADVIEAVARLGLAAVDHRIVEGLGVAAGDPNIGVLDDAGVEADDVDRVTVGALRAAARIHHHVVPPAIAQVLLELGPERAVVPESVESAVQVRRLVDEAAALAERHDLLHGFGRHRGGDPTTDRRAGALDAGS